MPRPRPRDAAWQEGRQAGSPTSGEVGRFCVGKRTFLVVAAPDPADSCRSGECLRFTIDEISLVILETTDASLADGEARNDAGVNEIATRLTGRELEIAVLVAHGLATKNIAYRLQISEWTVLTYMRRIFAKLNVENRAEMVFRCAPMINATLGKASDAARPASLSDSEKMQAVARRQPTYFRS